MIQTMKAGDSHQKCWGTVNLVISPVKGHPRRVASVLPPHHEWQRDEQHGCRELPPLRRKLPSHGLNAERHNHNEHRNPGHAPSPMLAQGDAGDGDEWDHPPIHQRLRWLGQALTPTPQASPVDHLPDLQPALAALREVSPDTSPHEAACVPVWDRPAAMKVPRTRRAIPTRTSNTRPGCRSERATAVPDSILPGHYTGCMAPQPFRPMPLVRIPEPFDGLFHTSTMGLPSRVS